MMVFAISTMLSEVYSLVLRVLWLDIAHAIGDIVSCILHGKMVCLGKYDGERMLVGGYLPMRCGNTVVP